MLNGLDGAACHLRVSRERLVVGLASADGRRQSVRVGPRAGRPYRGGRPLRPQARDRRRRARGELDGLDLQLLRAATDHLPIAELMRGIQAIS